MLMTKAQRRLDTIAEFGTPLNETHADVEYAAISAIVAHHAPRETSAARLTAARDARADMAYESAWAYV